MASFGWKRKISTVSKNKLFSDEDVDNDNTREDFDWLTPLKRTKTSNLISLEDAMTKCNRLKNEGITLADSERHWEAIKKWDEAVKLNPKDEKIHEMMAQVYLALNELLPAVKSAENCVKINPKWWTGHQTLGRTLLGIGEVKLAIRSFSKAIHLQPDEKELWEDDLVWACTLLKQHDKMIKSTTKSSTSVDLVDLDEKLNIDDDKICKQITKWSSNANCTKQINLKSRKWVRLRN